MTPTPGGALFEELLWVHDMLRADLEKVRGLAGATLDGAPTGEVEGEVAALRTNSPLWRLKTGCLAHCRFVHQHHRLEDIALFPSLRRANPALAPVIDKLAADHRSIAERVEEVETAVRDLGEGARADEEAARERVAAALERLAAELLEHLGYEEQNVAETMRSMTAL